MNATLPITEITPGWFERQVVCAKRPVLLAVAESGGRANEKLLNLLAMWRPEVAGLLDLVRVHAVGSPEFMRSCGVLVAPGLILFHQGSVCYQFIGEVSRHELDEVLTHAIVLTHARTAANLPGVSQPLPATEAMP
jgi:thioredoxin-like negative regulator of GroEL